MVELPLGQSRSIQADRLEPYQELVVAAGRLHNRVQPERPAVAEPGPGLLQSAPASGKADCRCNRSASRKSASTARAVRICRPISEAPAPSSVVATNNVRASSAAAAGLRRAHRARRSNRPARAPR